mgnify:CR=1 FL=1
MLIYDLDKKAVVLEPADSSGNVLVQAGIIKTRVPVGNLRLLKQEKVQKPKGRGVRTVKTRASAPVQQEVDLRGMTVEEGIMELDNFIDSALLSGITLLTVIHGKEPACCESSTGAAKTPPLGKKLPAGQLRRGRGRRHHCGIEITPEGRRPGARACRARSGEPGDASISGRLPAVSLDARAASS